MQTIQLESYNLWNRLYMELHGMLGQGGIHTLLATPGTVLESPQDGVVSLESRDARGPRVGQPATICWITDRHAATVIAVSKTGHKVTVRECKAIRTDGGGMSDSQSYRYEEDLEGETRTFYRNGTGSYGGGRRGTYLRLGTRRAYFDYGF